MKIIKIESCNICPHKIHKHMCENKYSPYCGLSEKDLPHNDKLFEKVEASIDAYIAHCSGKIPEFCKLEDES